MMLRAVERSSEVSNVLLKYYKIIQSDEVSLGLSRRNRFKPKLKQVDDFQKLLNDWRQCEIVAV